MQDAKARLSRVVKDARSKGPQIITLHGEEVAVVQSIEDYRRQKRVGPKEHWLDVLLKCPRGPELVIDRDPSDTVGAGDSSIFE